MANRLRATATALLQGGAARLRVTPALSAQAAPLLQAQALACLPVSLHATTAGLLLQAQARLTAQVPSLHAQGQPLLGDAGARLVSVSRGLGLAPALIGAPLGLGWPWYSAGQAPALIGDGAGQGWTVSLASGLDAGVGPGAAHGYGRNYGDAWVAWFETWFAGDSDGYRLSALCPTVTGYHYRTDAGLVRTPMTDGVIRQRRRWTTARQELALRFVLDSEELRAAAEFWDTMGPDWFTMSLVTGRAVGPSLHTVRLIADPQVKAMTVSRHFEYLLTVETNGFNPAEGSSS